jgi:glucuronate isomerase
MKKFMDSDFLLDSEPAVRLYHDFAADMPIYDYHSHLPADQIAEDSRFENITQIWLYGDHYKWRAMRACGVGESLVSGRPERGGDYERFEAWTKVVPQTICNPLYHWSHMELRRYFGIEKLLSPKTAREIYDACAEKLKSPDMSVRSIIRRSDVRVICTTDDPTDKLTAHEKMGKESWGVKVYPTWRPDKALSAGDAKLFNQWVDKLESASDTSIANYGDFLLALRKRHDCFHKVGCRLSDYGIERPYSMDCAEREAAEAFAKARGGTPLEGGELEKYRSGVLFALLSMDAESDWTQQLHLAARRDNSSHNFAVMGPDTGYDSIGNFPVGADLVRLFDRLEAEGRLARTIVYTLNPADNDMLASIAGSFMDGRTPGKTQFGAAWWFNDQKNGMERHMESLAGIGLLSRFVGMLTDSRSFLSYPRHEYFRRILCNFLGGRMERGELPGDFSLVGGVVRDICYNNAARYFRLQLPE